MRWRKINIRRSFLVRDTKAFIQIKKFSFLFSQNRTEEVEGEKLKWIWNSNNALNFPRTPPTFLCAFFSQLSAIEMIFFWFGCIVRKINKWKIENCIPKKNKWNKEKVFSHFFSSQLTAAQKSSKTRYFIIFFLRIDIYFIHINFHLFDFHFFIHMKVSREVFDIFDWRHSRQGQKIEKKTNIQWYIKHVSLFFCCFLVKKVLIFFGLRWSGEESVINMEKLSKIIFHKFPRHRSPQIFVQKEDKINLQTRHLSSFWWSHAILLWNLIIISSWRRQEVAFSYSE